MFEAISAIAAAIIAWIAYKNYKLKSPAYAIISKDGNILWQSNFGKYNLFVKKEDVPGKDNDIKSSYILKFDRVPDYFEVSTQELAMREISKISEKEYKVRFVEPGEGWYAGHKVKKCDFKIQAYD
jgi:hypothetical protein